MPESLAPRLAAGRDPANPPASLGAGEAPGSLDAAYRAQARLVRLLARQGGRPVGYKIGATSLLAQRFLGVGGPFAGQVLARGLHRSPARLPAGAFRFRLVEPEYAFTLARPLPARARSYTPAEVAAAVGTLHPAIEIVTSAYGEQGWQRVGGLALIADNGAHGALVLGEGRADWQRFDLARERVELRIDGRLEGSGDGRAVLGHPLAALAWVATELARQGRGLQAGEVITTGVVTPFRLVAAGQRVEAQFGPFGFCRLEFT
jgi:2-keto-4-pentenoate hydratase